MSLGKVKAVIPVSRKLLPRHIEALLAKTDEVTLTSKEYSDMLISFQHKRDVQEASFPQSIKKQFSLIPGRKD